MRTFHCVGGIVACAALVACGGVIASVPEAGADAVAAVPEAGAPDVAMDPCDLAKPFGAAVAITELNTAFGEEWPSLMPDELTLYFSSSRTGTLGSSDLYVATRISRTAPFGAAVPLKTLNSSGNEYGPYVTPDGLTLYWHGGSDRLTVATRSNLEADFAGGQLVPGLASIVGDQSGAHVMTATTPAVLFFVANAGPSFDIYAAQANGAGFQTPKLVPELDTPSSETSPFVTEDGLTVFFASSRAGGVGDLDVWTATRASTSAPFGTPTNVKELNSNGAEYAGWLSTDRCRMYFTSSRKGGAGGTDLYVAARPR